MDLECRALTPQLWPDLEKLFGSNGACGGCWCMAWRVEKGEKWAELKGPRARARMKALVESGRARGVLAYVDGEPVGWCSVGKRVDFPKLNRAPSLACDDAERVWSLPCFFVKRGFRGQGVASALIAAAVELLRDEGAEIAEGYPARPGRMERLPHAFAWTGVPQLFARAGFEPVGPAGAKQRMRLVLGGEPGRKSRARGARRSCG